MIPRAVRSGPGAAALAAACIACAAVPASASVGDTTAVLAGRVVLAASGAPTGDARVELVGQGHATITDSLGRFRLVGLEPGPDTLAVSRLGGQSAARPVRLEAGATTRVEVVLDPQVIDLGGFEVTVEGPPPTRLRRLADRIGGGAGEYITRDELDDHTGRLSFAFRRVVGTRVTYVGGGDFRVQLRRDFGRGYCSPELFVDGHRHRGVPVDAWEADEVAAVEVYTSTVVPGEFRTMRAMDCGAVLIWTRSFVQ